MKMFGYKVISFPAGETQMELNKLGREGWELVVARYTAVVDEWECVLKRPAKKERRST